MSQKLYAKDYIFGTEVTIDAINAYGMSVVAELEEFRASQAKRTGKTKKELFYEGIAARKKAEIQAPLRDADPAVLVSSAMETANPLPDNLHTLEVKMVDLSSEAGVIETYNVPLHATPTEIVHNYEAEFWEASKERASEALALLRSSEDVSPSDAVVVCDKQAISVPSIQTADGVIENPLRVSVEPTKEVVVVPKESEVLCEFFLAPPLTPHVYQFFCATPRDLEFVRDIHSVLIATSPLDAPPLKCFVFVPPSCLELEVPDFPTSVVLENLESTSSTRMELLFIMPDATVYAKRNGLGNLRPLVAYAFMRRGDIVSRYSMFYDAGAALVHVEDWSARHHVLKGRERFPIRNMTSRFLYSSEYRKEPSPRIDHNYFILEFKEIPAKPLVPPGLLTLDKDQQEQLTLKYGHCLEAPLRPLLASDFIALRGTRMFVAQDDLEADILIVVEDRKVYISSVSGGWSGLVPFWPLPVDNGVFCVASTSPPTILDVCGPTAGGSQLSTLDGLAVSLGFKVRRFAVRTRLAELPRGRKYIYTFPHVPDNEYYGAFAVDQTSWYTVKRSELKERWKPSILQLGSGYIVKHYIAQLHKFPYEDLEINRSSMDVRCFKPGGIANEYLGDKDKFYYSGLCSWEDVAKIQMDLPLVSAFFQSLKTINVFYHREFLKMWLDGYYRRSLPTLKLAYASLYAGLRKFKLALAPAIPMYASHPLPVRMHLDWIVLFKRLAVDHGDGCHIHV